jgi:hypothetical protein
MASKFANTQPVIRDHEIEGYPVRITIDGDGVTFQRKGDRSRDKAQVVVPWSAIAEIGADKDPNVEGKGFYAHLGFDA